MFRGRISPLHNGGTTSASIIRVDTACIFGSTEKYQTKEERKTEWSQTEEQTETTQAVSSSDYYGECAVVGKTNSMRCLLVLNFQHEYRMCSIMCYTETWLSDDVPDSHVNMEGFSLFRSDRTKGLWQKEWRWCVFVSEKWCHRIKHVSETQSMYTKC